MKRAGRAVLSAAVALACACFLLFGAAAEGQSYVFGNDEFNIEGVNVTQGYNGWYFLYSKTSSNGETFPLDTLKEAEQNLASGQWKVPESEGKADWWAIRSDGFTGPANGFCVGLKWVVPEDGLYNVKIDYFGGTSDTSQEMADGVIFFVYRNDQLLSRTETTGKNVLPQGDDAIEVNRTAEQLKKGETFYMIVDPKSNSAYDNGWWNVKFEKAVASSAEPSSGAGSSEGQGSSAVESEPSGGGVSSEAQSASSDVEATDSDGSYPVWVPIAVAAGVVIVGCGVAVLILYKKKIGPFAKK